MRAFVILFLAALGAAQNKPNELLDAARAGKTRRVEELLKNGADLEARDPDGRTALMLAAQNGRTAAVQLLLAKGADAEARDVHGWNAYMLALLAPSGKLLRTHDSVLQALPQPRRYRLALNAAWRLSEEAHTSCFLRPEELMQRLRGLRPDGLAIEAFQRFAIGAGKDLIAIVQSDALGTSEVPNKTPPEDIDATLFLMVEPGVNCVYHADQLSLTIHATLTAPGREAPMLQKSFGNAARAKTAANPNQLEPLYGTAAKSQTPAIYWAAVTALMEKR